MQISSFELNISPPASSYQTVLEMKGREVQPDILGLVDFLETDPVTVCHLLRQVNSPEYSLRQNVTALERAVSMLGFETACTTILKEWSAEKKNGVYSEAARGAYTYIVRTSVAAGTIAKTLARKAQMSDVSTVVTCALMHQLGRLAILGTDPITYSGLWTDARMPTGEPIKLPPGIGREMVHYRTDYTKIGSNIAGQWDLPAELRGSIRFHSDPEKVEDADRRVIMAVAVAQMTARSLFEPPDALNRDQSKVRVEKAYVEVARECGMLLAEVEALLSDAKGAAFERAQLVGLHPLESPS